MDLRLLSYFLSIVEKGSVTSASKVLHIGQPSLSRQIRKFERDLGIQLLSKGPRMKPTAAGLAFLPIARDLMSRAEQAESAARALESKASIRLTIAGPPTTVADIIAPFIALADTKGFLTNIRECLPSAVYEELLSGRADLVIGTNPPPSQLQSSVIGRVPIWAQVPADHPMAKKKTVTVSELSNQPIAIVDDHNNVRRIFDNALAKEGLPINIAFETQSSHASQALAAANRAICISSDDPRYGLHPLLIETPHGTSPLLITLFAAWDPLHYASQSIVETVAEIRQFHLSLPSNYSYAR
jgi:DNA-binding transcriptional LysR family regulator